MFVCVFKALPLHFPAKLVKHTSQMLTYAKIPPAFPWGEEGGGYNMCHTLHHLRISVPFLSVAHCPRASAPCLWCWYANRVSSCCAAGVERMSVCVPCAARSMEEKATRKHLRSEVLQPSFHRIIGECSNCLILFSKTTPQVKRKFKTVAS